MVMARYAFNPIFIHKVVNQELSHIISTLVKNEKYKYKSITSMI